MYSRREAVLGGALYGVLFVLGFGVGVYGAFYHSLSVWVVPVGVIAAIAVTAAMCWAIRRRLGDRLPAAVAAGGWLAAVVLLASERSAGDLVIAGSLSGYLLIIGGAAAVASAIAVPGRGNRPGRGDSR